MKEKFIINFIAFSIFPAIFWLVVIIIYELNLIFARYNSFNQQIGDELTSNSPVSQSFILLVWIFVASFIVWMYKNDTDVKLFLLFGAMVILINIIFIFILLFILT